LLLDVPQAIVLEMQTPKQRVLVCPKAQHNRQWCTGCAAPYSTADSTAYSGAQAVLYRTAQPTAQRTVVHRLCCTVQHNRAKQQAAQQQSKLHRQVASSNLAGNTQLLAGHWWRDTQVLAANLKLPVSVVRQLDEEELYDMQQLHAFLKEHHLEEHFMPVLRCCSDGKQLAERIELVDCFVGYIGPQCSHGDARAAWDEAMQLLWYVQQLHAYGRAGPYLPLVDMLLLAESPVQLQSELQRVHALLSRLPTPKAALAAAQAAAAAVKVAAVERMKAAAAAEEAAAIRTAVAYTATPAVVAASWHAAVPEAVVARAGLINAELAADLAEEYALYAPPKQQQPASAPYSFSARSSSNSNSMPAWQGSPTAAVETVTAAATADSSSSQSTAASPFNASADVAAAAAGSMAAAGEDTTPEGPSYSACPSSLCSRSPSPSSSSSSSSQSRAGSPFSASPGRLSYDGPGTPAAVSVAASCAASPRPSWDEAGDDSSSSGGNVQAVVAGSKQQQRVAGKGGMLRGVAGCMPVRLLLKGLTQTALLCRPRFG
jgi:hypothetical protein